MMKRREFVKAGLVASAAGPAALMQRAPDDRHYFELRVYETRSDIAPARIRTFFQEQLLPGLQRAGAATVGVFSANIGMIGQSLILLVDWKTAADALDAAARLESDATFAT